MAGRKPSLSSAGDVVVRFKGESTLNRALRIYCFRRSVTINDAMLGGVALFLANAGITNVEDYVKQFEAEGQGQ